MSRQAGRPSKFKPEYIEQVAKLCALGATDREIAEFFEVSESTLNRWKLEQPGFQESIKDAKAVADQRVVRSLYQRALGYSHPDVHISNYQGMVTATPIIKHYPPDATSCIFWLKNRMPDEWRDKVALTDPDGQALGTAMAGIELARRAAFLLAHPEEAGTRLNS